MTKDRSGPPAIRGRLAQLVRAPALQAGSRGFESLTAHQICIELIDFKTIYEFYLLLFSLDLGDK